MLDRALQLCAPLRKPAGTLLLAGLWLAGVWLGFATTERVEDAYEEACVERDCPSVDGSIQLLRYSIILNAFAVPLAFAVLRRDAHRRGD